MFLSPGPSKQNYFEHAYLARYLGFNFVEGSDLTVRDDRVYLKTVEGLKPVDLIMRRINSDLCDPLELRTDSLIGVPGLLQAARAGKVTIGNALGSGLVESDSFLSFLPSLSKHFLDEELAMPSLATWWCGQERERRYVLDHLDELVVRRVNSSRSLFPRGQEGLITPDMPAEDRERLIREIERNGHEFIGQEPMSLSLAPTWSGPNSLRAAPVLLRVYVAATSKGYEVMPGGLTRVADGTDPHASWLELSDVSKDTWVLSDQPVEQFSLLAQRQASQRLRPRRPRFAEPHGRQPVLARPLHGARRRRRAFAAQPRDPVGRRDGLDAHAGVAGARRRDVDGAEALVDAPRAPRDAGRPAKPCKRSSGRSCSIPSARTGSRRSSVTCSATPRPCASGCRTTRSASCATSPRSATRGSSRRGTKPTMRCAS